jgi:hypothetical protein
MSKDQPDVIAQLRKVTTGLRFQSEWDYPVEPLVWEGEGAEALTSSRLLKLAKRPPGTPVKAVSLESFFRPATEEQDWHNADERATVARFKELVKALKRSLKKAKAYKVGETEIDVYVVGHTESGDLAGVRTKVVET